MAKKNTIVDYSIIFIAIVILFIVLRELSSILRPLTLAAFFTILCMPLYDYAKRKKIPAVIPLSGAFIVFTIITYLIVALLINDISSFQNHSEEYKEQIDAAIALLPLENMQSEEFNFQDIMSSQAFNRFLSSSIQGIGDFFSEFLLAALFAIFMIPAYRKLLAKLTGKHRNLKLTLMKIQTSTVQYLRTKTVISLGTALTSTIALALFGSDFIWTLTILIFIFNFVPNIGSTVAVGIALLLYLFKFGFGTAFVILFIILIVVQQVWGNIIEPHLAGKQLQLSPLLILVGLFFWGWLWGIGGMILSVPLLAVIKSILEHFQGTKQLAEYMQ